MKFSSRKIRLMGTIIEIKILHHNAESILDEAESLLHQYNMRFSANDSRSELMQINLNAGVRPVMVHPELFELIELGLSHSLAPGSHLNILIGPVVQLWRIGFDDAQLPTDTEIMKQLALTNPKKLQLNNWDYSVYLMEPGMKIDLGAIAKGYIADKVCAMLKDRGVMSGFINLGGNVLTFGPAVHQADQLWVIGIQSPQKVRGENIALLKIAEESVVTSGVYERVLELNGQRYHHIFDPKTGYPMATNIDSITIVSKKSVDCEIWTTRLFGKDIQTIMNEVAQHPELEVIVITNVNEVFCSKGLHNRLFIDN